MDASELLVSACPATLRPDAMRQLHAGLPLDQRAGLTEAIARTSAHDELAWQGLLVAAPVGPGGETQINAAVWIQPTPGNTAVIWPPPPAKVGAYELLEAAACFCDQRSIALAQMIVAEQDGFSATRLHSCGFARLADLVYLYAELPAQLPAAQNKDLAFIPSAGEEAARFAGVIEQTYQETKDCPALDGVRTMADVLVGYRAQGRHHPEHWYLVQSGGSDVGALILASHPASQNWELVYMGVTPQARGMGFGRRIVEFALRRATNAGGQRLVLAVDAANAPALNVYRAAGFIEWDRRTVYARLQRS
jgi:ribosomal protein S18 acetylase RimI-like enzyme